MKKLTVFLLGLSLVSISSAALRTQLVRYKQASAVLEGYLAYDDAAMSNRPGVLIIHEWMGLNDLAKKRADELAMQGYVAFAADIYGKGIRPTTPQEAGNVSGMYKKDRKLFRARVNAGLETLKAQKNVDATKLAAIGFCFGGTGALELARSGADVDGVICFHGSLNSPTPEDAKNIRCKVLALQGGDDPYVPADETAAFQKEMRDAKVDWELVQYGNTVHGYTNPAGGNNNASGYAYNEQSEKRAFAAMHDFFQEIFK